MQPTDKKVLITGGHSTPALAVVSELQKQGFNNFLWVGHKYNQFGNRQVSAEYTTVTGLGIEFIDLKAGKLVRTWGSEWLARVVNLIKVPWGFVHAGWIVLRHRPALVMSFGGYIALPVAVMAKILGKKVITHEQTAVTGLTNRIIPKFADKVLISWPSSAQYYPADKTVLTGNPLRPEIFAAQSDQLKFNNDLPVVYVTGGNQGSYKLNQAVFAALKHILAVTNVIHQTGDSSVTGDANTAQQLRTQLPAELAGRYIPQPYFGANVIGEVFAKADLVVTRSGANITYEMLALGKPAIFIPIPWVTHNEQMINAQLAAQTGIGLVLEEKELTAERLLAEVQAALRGLQKERAFHNIDRAAAQAAARKLVIFNAASKIAQIIVHTLNT